MCLLVPEFFLCKSNCIRCRIDTPYHLEIYLTKVFEYSIMSIVMNRFPQEVIGNVVRLRKRGRSLSEISFISGAVAQLGARLNGIQ